MWFLPLLAVAGGVLIWFGFRTARRRRRSAVFGRPFPGAWERILERNVPLSRILPPELGPELRGRIHVFLDEKHFEGAGGLELTDEIRVTIAAHACLLLLNRSAPDYPGLESIVVYPAAYVAPRERDRGGVASVEREVNLGEAWPQGAVVLSWEDVLRSARIAGDGYNVALHEFAHQLDFQDAAADGAPLLESGEGYDSWARVLSREFERLRRRSARGHASVLDAYGATNPAEFFAVATETFFENPLPLRRRIPDLYAELRMFYRVDPASWVERGTGGARE